MPRTRRGSYPVDAYVSANLSSDDDTQVLRRGRTEGRRRSLRLAGSKAPEREPDKRRKGVKKRIVEERKEKSTWFIVTTILVVCLGAVALRYTNGPKRIQELVFKVALGPLYYAPI